MIMAIHDKTPFKNSLVYLMLFLFKHIDKNFGALA